ncbi:MAG: FeoB-associated Cys-rich membrane protein [Lachnospiraceae bacterium]
MGTLIVGIIVVIITICAARSLYKDKKAGKCCGSCSGCNGSCSSYDNQVK